MKPPTFFIHIILTLYLCRGSWGLKPSILPNKTEIVINAGDSIHFECIHHTTVNFYTPQYIKSVQKIVASWPQEKGIDEDGMYKYTFLRHNATPSDTGWYGCADPNIMSTPEIFNDTDFSWIYFYVSSSEQRFVDRYNLNIIKQIANRTAIVSCRTTSPNFTVVLYEPSLLSYYARPATKEDSPYDPKFGFMLHNVTKRDEGDYVCASKSNIPTWSERYILRVFDDFELTSLTIDDKALENVIPGQNLHVNCTMHLISDRPYVLKWTTPHRSSRIKTISYINNVTRHIDKVIVKLIIKNVRVEDNGEYECYIGNFFHGERKKMFLKIHDKPSLLLTSIKEYYTLGQNADFQCEASAFPKPNITWYIQHFSSNPFISNGRIVNLKSKTKNLGPFRFLSKTTTKINASGTINCIACNSVGCARSAKFISAFDITSRPVISGFLRQRTVTEGERVVITCEASIDTHTDDITWTIGDKNRTVVNNEYITIVKNKTAFIYYSQLQIYKVRKEDANIYTCCVVRKDAYLDIVTLNLFVKYQRPPEFTNSSLNGRDLSIDLDKERYNPIVLRCYVNGMPKPSVTWYKDGTLLNDDIKDQYAFFNDNQELHIKYLLEKDNGRYSCRATNRLNTIEDYVNIVIKGKEFSKGLISLIVILLIIVVILVVYFTIKVRRRKILRKELKEIGLVHFEKGHLEFLNPSLAVLEQAELLPYNKNWEFPRERLMLGKQLGSGAFGVVMKAEARGICKNEAVTTVVVKMVRRTTEPTYVRALVIELKIMMHLGKHLNVVNLLGACTKNITKRELLVIMEYCRFGNLFDYLLKRREDFVNQIDPSTGKFDFMIGVESENSATNMEAFHSRTVSRSVGVTSTSGGCTLSDNSSRPRWKSNYYGDYKDQNLKPICTQDLLSWAFQVARGMDYLSQRKVLHGDLAARNILLAEDNVVKICDFGVAKTIYEDDNDKKKSDRPSPIKWMAIESIRDRIFSTQSDIWSFGIVLWEFFTLAETPYPGMEAEKQYQKLIEGYRMEQPAYATEDVYRIMLQCWRTKPTLRPSFTELVDSIGALLEENVKAYYITLNAASEDTNAMILDGKDDYFTMMRDPDFESVSSSRHSYISVSNTGNVPESNLGIPSLMSDFENTDEMSSILQNDVDGYLKPIKIHDHRIVIARQREVSKMLKTDPSNDRDFIYTDAPRKPYLMDSNVNEMVVDDPQEKENLSESPSMTSGIIRSHINYVNMLKQNNDFKKVLPDICGKFDYRMMSIEEDNQTNA